MVGSHGSTIGRRTRRNSRRSTQARLAYHQFLFSIVRGKGYDTFAKAHFVAEKTRPCAAAEESRAVARKNGTDSGWKDLDFGQGSRSRTSVRLWWESWEREGAFSRAHDKKEKEQWTV